jgi:hypothetical protein
MPHVDGVDDGVGYGVFGHSKTGIGVRGSTGDAVFDPDVSDIGAYVISKRGTGVHGFSTNFVGVVGYSYKSIGVVGYSYKSIGVMGVSVSDMGVYCTSLNGGYAAYPDGRVHIRGPLTKPGGSFKIDHPLDPAIIS